MEQGRNHERDETHEEGEHPHFANAATLIVSDFRFIISDLSLSASPWLCVRLFNSALRILHSAFQEVGAPRRIRSSQ